MAKKAAIKPITKTKGKAVKVKPVKPVEALLSEVQAMQETINRLHDMVSDLWTALMPTTVQPAMSEQPTEEANATPESTGTEDVIPAGD